MNKGQALVTLLFFMVIAISVITASSVILFTNVTAGSTTEQGAIVLSGAESGAENALLRLLRNPAYSGEALLVGNVNVNIGVTNGTIIATASANNVIRKIQVQTVYNGNVLSVSSWKEIQ